MTIRNRWNYLMAAMMLAATMLAGGTPSDSAEAAAPERMRLFLGPVPDKHRFSAPQPKDFQDSYRDIRDQYSKIEEFHLEFELVDDIDQADFALEITSRGLKDTGERHQGVTVIVHGKRRRDPDVVVPGAISSVNEKTLSARFVDLKSDYSVEIDGRVCNGTYRQLTKDILLQVVDWAIQNRKLCRTANSGLRMGSGPQDAINT